MAIKKVLQDKRFKVCLFVRLVRTIFVMIGIAESRITNYETITSCQYRTTEALLLL